MRRAGLAAALGTALALLAGCGSILPRTEAPEPVPAAPSAVVPAAIPPPRGAYYKDDGPGDNPPPNLASLPDAVPRSEPLHRFANRPYQVFGRDYVPQTSVAPFRQRGTGSWYGRRFHGGATSSGEPYDMFAMTAAHPVLPIPSYARVTNVANGRSVVVRVNDRGPFHAERIIDLSYAAAFRLGYVEAGSALLDVETVLPQAMALAAAAPGAQATPPPAAPAAAPAATASVYLQLGAFGARENAESFRARIARELAWAGEALQIFASGGLFRLHLGPYRTPDEARGIAERIQAGLSFRPVLVFR